MKISGSAGLHATPDAVWAAITDPAVLAAVIPGCDALTPLTPDRFGLTVSLGVASIKGSYTGEVAFSDMTPPSALTMRANGSGGPGTIDTTVRVMLTELADGSTRVDYDADAMVGGMVGGVGQRVLAGVAKKTAGLFFAAIDQVLTGARPVAATPAVSLVSGGSGSLTAGGVGEARAAAGAATGATTIAHRPLGGVIPLIAAGAFGAASMLVGVLVGARIASRAR